ncbi:RagB/SusD family nutrient uptake outer membrane protein [Antarcticibacterium flavum]|uniref:RagB/SusD family nutrient uptake outer membrane protein n=1 Tax=Antarcticibacterium flavum TaxID=2058175 RepID=A0A5B7X2R2_9FLAO|nr:MULTISPECIES: RagB/SusD family nutrient uptake outer membrane protein [Antarcticibacterium]MCM4160950.1 RagB/SusD family nutrient uptake outer membrane protein [Antarcticibacterium sp. W02-3]QCY68992.1 RagB/SusD family nutrient uptake outer membrane protein [Antarcticibacterium flavum]
MKRLILIAIASLVMLSSCEAELDVAPRGVLNEGQIATPEGAEGFVIAAYSQLGNDEINRPFSLWPYGNVRADDAYKGGRDPGDGQGFHFMETYTNIRPDMWEIDGMWFHQYIGVRRANEGLRILSMLTEEEYPLLEVRTAELRFLRGHFYFQLKILFNRIPYMDEHLPAEEYKFVSNVELSSDELWEKIADDFEFAAQYLPQIQPQIGRADQVAAYAYLAKTRLYQAYEKNEQHQVENINFERLQQVIDAANQVIGSNHFLEEDFANNFLTGGFENGPESIFAVQFSTNDGVGRGRVNYGTMLTTPQGIGCCDFQKPSQNLMNAFKTSQGVPFLENFNESNLDFNLNTVDPRLDHTIARPNVPWKYESDVMFTEGWSRSPQIYGFYNSLKENVKEDEYINVDPFYGNTKPRIILRYADVLLFKAEALVELGRLDEALDIINQLRLRAANSTERLVDANGTLLANYDVEPYIPGVNITWDQETARQAVRFERRLELALEGSRFFDLVRWGNAEEVLNNYLDIEATRREYLSGGMFVSGKHEYLPIPQNQIFWSEDRYIQNPGY